MSLRRDACTGPLQVVVLFSPWHRMMKEAGSNSLQAVDQRVLSAPCGTLAHSNAHRQWRSWTHNRYAVKQWVILGNIILFESLFRPVYKGVLSIISSLTGGGVRKGMAPDAGCGKLYCIILLWHSYAGSCETGLPEGYVRIQIHHQIYIENLGEELKIFDIK